MFILGIVSCKKKDVTCNITDSTIVAPASEIQSIQNYLETNNIATTAHPSGFFYKIITKGTGASVVNLCSTVTVSYVGKLTNGTIFDQTPSGSSASFQLGQLIVGWQKGIPLINAGGTIRLYIPPSLGYGPNAQGPIPGNSILIFDITVVSIS